MCPLEFQYQKQREKKPNLVCNVIKKTHEIKFCIPYCSKMIYVMLAY